MPAAPSGSETTVVPELSDSESVKGTCSSGFPSPRPDTPECVDGQCKVYVKATFLDVDESQGLMQCFAQLRGRTMSDSAAVIAFDIEEAYAPGKFSEQHASDCIAKPTTVCAKEPATQPKSNVSDRTTVMLRNIPNNYTREMFLALLDDNGFAGRYDFVYVPCDFRRQANLGYAFVNLVDASAVDAAWATFDGFADWALPTQK
ncbi:ML4, partial [Symbiodinium sp. CCMP2456]